MRAGPGGGSYRPTPLWAWLPLAGQLKSAIGRQKGFRLLRRKLLAQALQTLGQPVSLAPSRVPLISQTIKILLAATTTEQALLLTPGDTEHKARHTPTHQQQPHKGKQPLPAPIERLTRWSFRVAEQNQEFELALAFKTAVISS